jgi:hypothetical protein
VANPATLFDIADADEMISTHVFFPDGTVDFGYWWCECPICGKLGLQYLGYSAEVCSNQCFQQNQDDKQTFNSFVLLAAYEYAQHYNFDQPMEATYPFEDDYDEEM